MNRLRLLSFFVLALALTGFGFAKDHDKKDRDRDDVRRHDRDRDRDRDGDHDRDDRRIRRHRDRDRDRDDRGILFGRDSSRPPGWDRGRKEGWGDCDVPPGQAKKVGCHTRFRHHHRVIVRHDRDRDRDRRRRRISSRTTPPGTTVATGTPVRRSTDRDPFHPVRVSEVKQ